MRLTTRGRYAVTAMLDLALNIEKRPVTLSEIADRQGISQSYLETIIFEVEKKRASRWDAWTRRGLQARSVCCH